MAYLFPDDITDIALQQAHQGEIATLRTLRQDLPPAYTVFHSVHWAQNYRSEPFYGEIDFVIVNAEGQVLLIEQKNGSLREEGGAVWKDYGASSKNVIHQLNRSRDAVLEQFKRQQSNQALLKVGTLIYCPDHRVWDHNAAGLDEREIVDSSRAGNLAECIRALLPLGPGQRTAHGETVHEFFRQTLHLHPDIHTYVDTQQETFTRLSGGLAQVLERIEMEPLRLRLKGAPGSGKSQVAAYFYRKAVAERRTPLLVCYNHPLAHRLRQVLPAGGHVANLHQLWKEFLEAKGHHFDFQQRPQDGAFWQEVETLVEQESLESMPAAWRFDPVIVDEGQDFKENWFELLEMFGAEQADFLWLEDPHQNVRGGGEVALKGFIGYSAPENYRTPSSIARFIQSTLDFDFQAANDLPGMGVGVTPYQREDGRDLARKVGHRVQELVKAGFAKEQIVVLTIRGQTSSALWPRDNVGAFGLSRFTGEYDADGQQIMSPGEIRLESVGRFKGQQAPAVVLAEVDPNPDRLARELDRIYTGMTRATVRLELVVAGDNPENQRFLTAEHQPLPGQ